jgi:hypothetical protein
MAACGTDELDAPLTTLPTRTATVARPTVSKPAATPTPTPSRTTAAFTPTLEPAPPTIEGTGTFLVGEDIQPGTYRSPGANDDGQCYWQRLSGLSGTNDDYIAYGSAEGPQVVTISPSDVAFKIQDCLPWEPV